MQIAIILAATEARKQKTDEEEFKHLRRQEIYHASYENEGKKRVRRQANKLLECL